MSDKMDIGQLVKGLLRDPNSNGGLETRTGVNEDPSSPVTMFVQSDFDGVRQEILALQPDAKAVLKHHGYDPEKIQKDPAAMPSKVGTPVDHILSLATQSVRLTDGMARSRLDECLADWLDLVGFEDGLEGCTGVQKDLSSSVTMSAPSDFEGLRQEILTLQPDAEAVLKHYGFNPKDVQTDPRAMPSTVGTPVDHILGLATRCVRLANIMALKQ